VAGITYAAGIQRVGLSSGGAVSGSIVPAVTNTYSLGSSSILWANVYATTVRSGPTGNTFLSDNLASSGSGSAMSVRGNLAAADAGADVELRAVNIRSAGKIVSIKDNNGSTERAYFTFAGRLGLVGGTALVAGDFALSAGFGASASISAIATGTNDSRGRITITSAGAGQGASPTCTLTFKDGTWTTAPFAVVCRSGGSQPTIPVSATTTATTMVITFHGTPVAAETYSIFFQVEA
jgi:hypothetical protein